MNDVMRENQRELTAPQAINVQSVKKKGNELYELFESLRRVSNGTGDRDFAIAKTKLEEAVMWAVKGISA